MGQLARCPYCNTEFFASADTAHFDVVDDTADTDEEAIEPQATLDNNKIRQLSALRRGTLRARSWCWIATTVAAAAAVELLIKAGQNAVHTHAVTGRAIGFVLFATLAVILAMNTFRTGKQLTAEIKASRLDEPASDPDFSSLSDGSQRWKNLHDIR